MSYPTDIWVQAFTAALGGTCLETVHETNVVDRVAKAALLADAAERLYDARVRAGYPAAYADPIIRA